MIKFMYDIDLIFDPLLNPLKLLHDLNPFFVNLFLSYLSLVRVLHEIFLRFHKSFSVSIQLYRLQLSPAHFCVTLALIFVVFSILNIQMMYKDLCLFQLCQNKYLFFNLRLLFCFGFDILYRIVCVSAMIINKYLLMLKEFV